MTHQTNPAGARSRLLAALACAASLAACGGNGSDPDAERSALAVQAQAPGLTPFIAFVTLHGSALDRITGVHFTIAAAPGSVSKPVSVQYSAGYLRNRGQFGADGESLHVPVFGLYAGANNPVTFDVTFADGSVASLRTNVQTAAWSDPNGLYDHRTDVVARAGGSTLGFDFMYLKSSIAAPVILDSDGQVRWTTTGVPAASSSTFANGAFVIASTNSPSVRRLDLDGTLGDQVPLQTTTGALYFHHDLELGKTGLLGAVDTGTSGTPTEIGSVVDELDLQGHVLNEWNMEQIIGDLMTAGGDDATLFVRPGVDWFHNNTQVYDPSDDSVIISGREDFIVKVDYATHAVKWIFGDPTKYWYTFASLRAKALTMVGSGLVPIGQHSVNIAPDGSLLLFNNGTPSANQPAGAPIGASRPYSAVSDYRIDPVAMTVTQQWSFDHGQTYSAPFCSSAKQVADGSLLVDYADADATQAAHLVGLDPLHNVVFDYRFPNAKCNTAWNAAPLALDALSLD